MGYHYDLIREVMRKEGFEKDAFSVSLLGNSYVDIFQADEVEYVIDDDFCRVSKKLVDFLHFDELYNKDLIDAYFRQLIFNTYNAVYEKVSKNDKLGLFLIIGISMHIIQDFYAHSNWVELEINKYSNIKDATYFDILVRNPSSLDKAIQTNSNYGGTYGKAGLFTHFTPVLSHDSLNKDHAGRPYFDWAYRSAYKASLEWLRLIKKWILDLRGEYYWKELLKYEFKEGSKKYLYTLTDFDEGTIRWLCTYGGAWKTPRRWIWIDVLGDDMPNVPGIGVKEQQYPDYPFLGIEWFSNCYLIAKDLFEASSKNGFTKLYSVEKLEEGIKKKNNFGEIVKVNYLNVKLINPLDNKVIREAYSFLANSALDYESIVKWLRIRIPEAMDLDSGEGGNNINNEEPGGTSDYWVMFIINNELDHPYTEAEYVDQSHPFPVWGVLKPLWNKDTIRIQIRMYESDCGLRGAQHKDEEMDISPSSDKSLIFTFDPNNLQTLLGCTYLQGCSCWWINNGRYIKSSGTGDLRARVYVKVWIMNDLKEEILFPVFYDDDNCDNKFLPIFYDIPNLEKIGFNDKTTSIYIPPYFWKAQVFENKNYSGKSLTLDRTIQDLKKDPYKMGDNISSVKVINSSSWPSNLPEFPTFYEDKNFSGAFLKLPYNLPNNSICGFYSELSLYNFNDKISSIRIPPNWKVIIYEHTHFEGKSLELTSSVNDLSPLKWEDKISSIRLIPPTEVYQSSDLREFQEMVSREIISNLKENLIYFPEKFSNSLFYYKRSDLKIIENWAYIEVDAKNYLFKGITLFYKENDQWEVKEIINPDYLVCNDLNKGVDILSWIYIKLAQKYQDIPQGIFPEISPERKLLLNLLRKNSLIHYKVM